MNGLLVAGHMAIAWALGLALNLAFLDFGPGFERDHPPHSRRIAGLAVGPLALLSFLCLAAAYPAWITGLIVAPFAAMATATSLAWLRGWRPQWRRAVGRDTAIIGGVSLVVLMLTAGPEQWDGGIVIGAYCGSAGLLGGLTLMLLIALDSPPGTPEQPYSIPARSAGVGLGVGALSGLQILWNMLVQPAVRIAGLGIWLGLSLLVPALLALVGLKLYPKLQRPIWSAALLSAVGGQIAIHAVLLAFPGLIPPAIL